MELVELAMENSNIYPSSLLIYMSQYNGKASQLRHMQISESSKRCKAWVSVERYRCSRIGPVKKKPCLEIE